MENIKQKRELVFAQILYLFIIPTLLFYFQILSDDLIFIVMLGVALLLFGIIRKANWSYADLGIKKNYMKDIIPHVLFTVGGVFFLIWLSVLIPNKPLYQWWENARFLLLFIPISILQEIIFRGILMKMLLKVFSNVIIVVLINAAIFSLMHLMYANSTFVLPLTFIGGIAWAWMYYKYKNLILISFTHIIINFTGMTLGFFIGR